MMGSERSITVRFNVFALKHQLELRQEREISWAEISRETKLHHNTLHNIAGNQTRRVDLETLERLLEFFRSKGMDVKLGDLFEVTGV